jgi:hypothetical protein
MAERWENVNGTDAENSDNLNIQACDKLWTAMPR